MTQSLLHSCVAVLVCADLEKSAAYYGDALGFRIVAHFDHAEKFAAAYRDAVEIVLVQAQGGQVRPNRDRYGAGFDAYLVPVSLEAVDAFYEDIRGRGATILQPPALTAYGSREFVFSDPDGHQIGVGLIQDEATFFEGREL